MPKIIIRCVDCGHESEPKDKETYRAKVGLGIYCTKCHRNTPHNLGTLDDEKDSEQPLTTDAAKLIEHCEMHTGGEPVLIPTGCDECVIGTYYDDDRDCWRAVISLQRLQAYFEKEFEEDEEPEVAASEWIGFNVVGAYLGPQTPLYVDEVETIDE